MKKELTNEEIAKVFAMHWGCSFYRKDDNHYTTLKSRTYIDVLVSEYILCAIPISKISNEDALEVAEILGIGTNNILIRRRINLDKETFVQLYYLWDDCEKVVLNIGEGLHPFHANRNRFIEEYFGIEYLKSKGYALPLFFVPNHWANGKTAIELGIAIDATTIKAEI